MGRKEYKFNPKTLVYEEVTPTGRVAKYRTVRKLLLGILAFCIINIYSSFSLNTHKMERIQAQNEQLLTNYNLLESEIDMASKTITELKQRDNYVYRSLFAADTLDIEGVYKSYPDSDYAHLRNNQYADIMTETWKKMDATARLLYLQSKSLDQIEALSLDKDMMAASIPAIWPINKRELKHGIGAYGMRFHPIYKRRIFHKGIDLAGKTGTPIYATGNGTVKATDMGRRRVGYGQQVVIDHNFGYQTRYAHLNKILVKEGDKVVRGQIIGEMGNTGGSTGTHLHYEVIYLNQNVNPINYFRQDMSEEELEQIIESAKVTTFETMEGSSGISVMENEDE